MSDPLEELFQNYRPELGDNRAYMANLDTKLRAVEIIQESMKQEKKTARKQLTVAFILGSILGGLAIWFLTAYPFDIHSIDLRAWAVDNIRQIVKVVLISIILGYAAASIFLKEGVVHH